MKNTGHCVEAVSAHMNFSIAVIREITAPARETQGSEIRGMPFIHSVINKCTLNKNMYSKQIYPINKQIGKGLETMSCSLLATTYLPLSECKLSEPLTMVQIFS